MPVCNHRDNRFLGYLFTCILCLSALSSCARGSSVTATPALTTAPTATAPSTPNPSPTLTLFPTRTPRPTEVPLIIQKDLTYTRSLQPEVKDRALDMYAPAQTGEWPVIILAHGFQQSKDAFVRMGKLLAREGAVVFAIEWPAYQSRAGTLSGDGSYLRERTETFNCAVRFASAHATAFTKTPQRVTMVGYSLGGWFGLLASLEGGGLDVQWQEFESSYGSPPPQVSCELPDGTLHVDAFVGYGGGYTMIDVMENQNTDLVDIVSIFRHIGENPALRIRAIQGIYDSVLSKEVIQKSEELITALAEAGYDAQWLEVDSGHGFSSSGETWEYSRQVIMDAARP